ncbi:hypothetical protein GCM10012275_57440 [Longimycelium tulufanense]|uniref:Uncharacterized protein n=1 Tax=Longimycelium tulufanense TaxID=907463 RepID=A0A8J3FWQ1_9PSEU|nr:hypothetical protein [Longimycelium tulufanense]GGM79372.1 hypothetical protein GCM10012275_57440 [Longimycelium tulufanense]
MSNPSESTESHPVMQQASAEPAAEQAVAAEETGDSAGITADAGSGVDGKLREAVAELGDRLDQVEHALTPGDGQAPLVKRVDETLDTISALVDTVGELAGRVETVEKSVRERQQTRREHQRVYRFELYSAKTDEAKAKAEALIAERMERLGEWVAWLVRTYRLASVIPPCWAAHPLIFEELAGLRVDWAGAWTDAEARHDAVVVWHEQLWRFRERMSTPTWGAPTCPGRHDGQDTTYEEWAHSAAGQKAFEAAVDAAQSALLSRGSGS